MSTLKEHTKRLLLITLTFLLVGWLPMSVNADEIKITTMDKVVTVAPYNTKSFDNEIQNYFELFKSAGIEKAAAYFLNKPYFLEPLGEGKNSLYSQEPLYRTDQFDCVSYVDAVLALFHASNLEAFKQNIINIRYAGRKPHYIYRTDWFSDLEWFPNAERLGWLVDVTKTIVDHHQQPIYKLATTIIDKPNWYAVKPHNSMHLLEPIPQRDELKKRLETLRQHGQLFESQESRLSYLPLDRLFVNGEPSEFILQQFPDASVIAIVRPNWAIRDHFPGFPNGYGTNLNVSHLGFVIRTPEGLMFYNASSIKHHVMTEPLTDYLERFLDSPTIKGIHIERIL